MIIFILLLNGVFSFLKAETTPNKINRQPLVGEYLRNDYIDKINQTRSTLLAIKSNEPQMIIVKKEKNVLSLMTVFNFHEGGAIFTLRKDGTIVTETSAGDDVSNLQLAITDPKNIQLGYGRFKVENYQYVSDATLFVAQKILVGKYKDKKGHKYIFQEDGMALFPTGKFQYKIGLDHLEIPYEYFVDIAENKIYAFKLRDGILEIYNTSGEMNEIIADQPLLVLTKVQ